MSSAQATPPRATKRPKAGRAIDPATVSYDRDRSTKFTEVYDVPSASDPDMTYQAVYNCRPATWTCGCKAGDFATPCKHVTAAKLQQRRRWWQRNWAHVADETLRNEEPRRRRFLSSGDDEDRIAWDTLGDEIGRRMAESEAS